MVVMNDKLEGIILDVRDYKENDVMVKAMISDHGLLTLVAKGARKMRSKNAMALLPHTKSTFYLDYKEGKDIFTLHRAELIRSYYQEDIIKLSALAILAKVAYDSYSQDRYRELYAIIDKCYEATLDHDILVILSFYLMKVAELLGFGAYVDGCVICDERTVVSFSAEDGGFICKRHLKDHQICDIEVLKEIRRIVKTPLSRMDFLDDMSIDHRTFKLLAEHFYHHTGQDRRPYMFLSQVLRK